MEKTVIYSHFTFSSVHHMHDKCLNQNSLLNKFTDMDETV